MISLEINDVSQIVQNFPSTYKSERRVPLSQFKKKDPSLSESHTNYVNLCILWKQKQQPPYMGAVIYESLERLSEFSTSDISYPQYLGSYPQCHGTNPQ